ncbi:MAG: SCO family protein [Alphaproteobacteria bacterium]|nr:SCO family protein [Alphaproteobacteria bacterium]
MAGYAMNKACLSIAFLAALSLAACNSSSQEGETQQGEAPLAGASIGGPFTLTNQDGVKVSYSDFDGQYRMMYFGYSYCPDICPLDLQKLMQGYRLFAKQDPARAAKVQPIFITIDPDRDTESVLKNYVSAFDPKLIGLTGTPDEVAKVAKEFAVYYAKDDKSGASDYLVNHSRSPYLMGPDGKSIAILPTDQPGTDADEGSPQAVATELDRWVK